jgi:chitodextrinase
LLSSAKWDYYFGIREPSYTYTRFLQAVAKFPAVCGDYTDGRDADAICRHSLATMFAHFAQETGEHNASLPIPQWRQGLKYLRELGCDETVRAAATTPSAPIRSSMPSGLAGRTPTAATRSITGAAPSSSRTTTTTGRSRR